MVTSRTEAPETLELRVWEALATVHDPEIPPVRITDLGIVERVTVADDGIDVELLPTFAGCPALDVIREDVERALAGVTDGRAIRVRFVYSPPWTSDRITPEGRKALRSYGLTPPGEGRIFLPLTSLSRDVAGATCPFCASLETVLESAFGPTLCRTTHFCQACRNPFEAFKEKGSR
jgi:ring-1,2-phenylacetyl-CoA epoxidase subunit PaaD